MESKQELSDIVQKQLNGIAYESLPETTVAVNRTFERQFFQKSSYSSSVTEAICDLNTGAKFVNPRRSYLTFNVRLDAGTANFGHGSVCNLIRRVVVTTRSGTELSRTEDFNILMAKYLRWGCSREYRQQFGQLMGMTDDSTELETDFAQLSDTDVRFCIPLTLVSPFFIGDGKTLCPPQAMAGLRIQLTFAPDSQALISTTTPKYIIDDISIMANVTMMVDQWTKQLNEESARDGLTYTYPEFHTTQASYPANQTRLNIEVRKAVAQALFAFTVTKTQPDGYGVDNMKSDVYDYSAIEWRLGSLYPTQQPIKSAEEAYFIAQSAWDSAMQNHKVTNGVDFRQTITSTQPGLAVGASDGDAICAVSLERSDIKINQVLNVSGLPTNNSNVLAVDITGPSVGTPRPTYLFMQHVKMAKLYLDNSVTRE